MRAIFKGSKRKLTATNLVVDWEGSGTLIYRMSKARVKAALMNGEATMSERYMGEKAKTITYDVRHYPSGSIAIGCEHFNRDEVSELKKWSRAE